MSVNPAVDSNGPFQYVPVPNEHVPAVLAFIADLLSPVAVPAVRTSSDPLHSASSAEAAADWRDEQLVQFFALGTKTTSKVEDVLFYLAEQPGKAASMSTSEIAEALSMKYSEMKVLPTNVSRTLAAHFAGLGVPWCWESRNNEVRYWVSDERAEQLRRIGRR